MGQHINPLLFEGERLVRMIDKDGEPWFVAADVCAALDVRNPRDAVERLDEDEKGVVTADTLGGPQSLNIVSEAGVYRLVFTSRKPVAERFKRWLAHEVIPALRKTGTYGTKAFEMPSADEAREDDSLKIRKVNACRPIFGNQAAAQLWFKLGLEDVPAMHIDPRQFAIDFDQIKTVGEPPV